MSVGSKKVREALRDLSNLATIKESMSFKVDASPEHVVGLLTWASRSRDTDVSDALCRVGQVLSPVHKRFFESNGIVFERPLVDDSMVTYRGTKVVKSEEIIQSSSTARPRKSIVYRGQRKQV